ncbi:MAG TPA: DnaJ domain-containing protein [Chloroflexi bacterium]|nr:DnaJ domain-containing protein [Chloroflexota bacterium]
MSYYQTLQVKQDATQAEIAAAYRRLARQYHPDLNPAPDAHRQMQIINEAYNVLRHPERRQRYDETLAPPTTPASATGAARTSPPVSNRPSHTAAWLSYQKRIGDEIVFTIGHADAMTMLLADLQRRIPPTGRRYDIAHNRWHVGVEYEDVLRTLFRNYAPVVQTPPASQSLRQTPHLRRATARESRRPHHTDRRAWGGVALAMATALVVYGLIFSRMVLSDATAAAPAPLAVEPPAARTARALVAPASEEVTDALTFPGDCASPLAATAPLYFQEACKTLTTPAAAATPAAARAFALTTTRVASNIRSGPDTRFPVLTTAPPGAQLQLVGYTVSRGYVWFVTNFGGWIRSDLLTEAPMHLPMIGG